MEDNLEIEKQTFWAKHDLLLLGIKQINMNKKHICTGFFHCGGLHINSYSMTQHSPPPAQIKCPLQISSLDGNLMSMHSRSLTKSCPTYWHGDHIKRKFQFTLI